MTKRKTHNEFIEDLKRVSKGTIITHDIYTLAKNRMEFECLKCGCKWKTTACHVTAKKATGCPECSKNEHVSNQKLSKNDIIKRIDVEGKSEYLIHDWLHYKTTADKVKFKHITCGHIFEMTVNNFLSGQRCPKHRGERIGSKKRKPHSYYMNLIKKECIDYDEYNFEEKFNKGRDGKISVTHKKCGNRYKVSPGKFLDGRRCPYCASNIQSNSTKFIQMYLESENINFEIEKTFDGLINPKTGYPLRFDFYITDLNCIIEYDGEYHDKILNRNPEEKLKECQQRDSIKNNYCKDHNIPLLRISYKQKKELLNLIEEFIEVQRLSKPLIRE